MTGSELFGRKQEIAFLDRAWANQQVNVVTIVAWAGIGKSTLVNHWLRKMAADHYRSADLVFGWSFYRQGSSGETSSADEFLDAALNWFGDPNPRIGFLSHARLLAATGGNPRLIFNDRLDAVVTGLLIMLVGLILVESALEWIAVLTGNWLPSARPRLPVRRPQPKPIATEYGMQIDCRGENVGSKTERACCSSRKCGSWIRIAGVFCRAASDGMSRRPHSDQFGEARASIRKRIERATVTPRSAERGRSSIAGRYQQGTLVHP